MFTQSFQALPWSWLFYSLVIVLSRLVVMALVYLFVPYFLVSQYLFLIIFVRWVTLYFIVSRFLFPIIFVWLFLLWFLVSRFPFLVILCPFFFRFIWFRPTPVPDYASSLTPWYRSLVIPGFDPRLSFGLDIGFPWILLFAGSRLWTVCHSLKLVLIKNTISLSLNSVWRLVPVTQS